MRGVQFGDNHTADDWELILTAKSINPPEPKIVKVAVDGRDGDINLSRALTGEMKFNNRSASFSFLATEGTQDERKELIDEITNLIHGNELQIIDPDDTDHFLMGECKLVNVAHNKAFSTFDIEADCEPYKYALEEINRLITPTGTKTDIVLHNTGRKTLTPTLTVNGSITLEYGTTNVALETGTYKLTSLLLKSGATTVTVGGAGTITFTYREAVL